MVLLDMAAKGLLDGYDKLYVAHVNHGIRDDSSDDEMFVRELAAKYKMEYFSTKLNLAKNASEETARRKRYEFLIEKANELKAEIATAHHLDDVVESITINITRGTGWRGLAVMGRPGVVRPLLNMTKSEIYDYALKNKLEWVEDNTNSTDTYLRNRIRQKTMQLDMTIKKALGELSESQHDLSRNIKKEIASLSESMLNDRHVYVMVPENIAIELLRAAISVENITPPMNSQLARAVVAIKTALPGKICQVGDGVFLEFSRRGFIVRTS